MEPELLTAKQMAKRIGVRVETFMKWSFVGVVNPVLQARSRDKWGQLKRVAQPRFDSFEVKQALRKLVGAGRRLG